MSMSCPCAANSKQKGAESGPAIPSRTNSSFVPRQEGRTPLSVVERDLLTLWLPLSRCSPQVSSLGRYRPVHKCTLGLCGESTSE
jgi:hypothetical protein